MQHQAQINVVVSGSREMQCAKNVFDTALWMAGVAVSC